MKNIHLLPTDKPSRLQRCGSSEWFDISKESLIDDRWRYQNIYITSDEEIKEGDWCHTIGTSLFNEGIGKVTKQVIADNGKYGLVFKKIILTTNNQLIADGVQAIDDEFLEWFVKNPNCERVEFNAYPIGSNGNIIGTNRPYPFDGLICNFRIEYKIIIPQEEPKQETI